VSHYEHEVMLTHKIHGVGQTTLCLWFFWPLQYLLSWQKISLSFYN